MSEAFLKVYKDNNLESLGLNREIALKVYNAINDVISEIKKVLENMVKEFKKINWNLYLKQYSKMIRYQKRIRNRNKLYEKRKRIYGKY